MNLLLDLSPPDAPEIIVDLFAGGGGASTGIFQALGRHPDAAVNHNPVALAMHRANHPDTEHWAEDVWHVEPSWVTRGRPVGLLWASPDCTHFSKAKGGAPIRDDKVRSLASVITEKWIPYARPRVIAMENVEEFLTWGPLDSQGRIIEAAKGQTFRAFVNRMRRAGYAVQWRELRACDFGAPTIRKRLFLVARCDGRPIVWTDPTHGDPKGIAAVPGKIKPWRTAAECIDWSIPVPSIFERSRPLADNTLRRIAKGVQRYVLDAARPFIVQYNGCSESHGLVDPMRVSTSRDRIGLVAPHLVKANHGYEHFRGNTLEEPLRTVTANEPGFALSAPVLQKEGGPFVLNLTHGGRNEPIEEPLRTITCARRGEKAIVTPVLVGAGGPVYAGKPIAVDRPMNSIIGENHQAVVAPLLVSPAHSTSTGRSLHAWPPLSPLRTITTSNDFSVVSACLEAHYGSKGGKDNRVHDIEEPARTVSTENRFGVVAASLVKNYGGVVGQDARQPLGTVTSVDHHSVVAASIQRDFGHSVGHAAGAPMGTITGGGGGKSGVVAAHMTKLRGTCRDGQPMDAPAPTVTGGGQHQAVTMASMVKYYGTGGQHSAVGEPMHTATAKARMGLVTVGTGGDHAAEVRELLRGFLGDVETVVDIDGERYIIRDIGLRMLQPRELFNAQGFPPDYIIDVINPVTGKPVTKADQVRACGNSVPPPFARALAQANVPELRRVGAEVGA
ncbi:MAG: DNA cytosine methyltransferase [Desulfovibrionaceae bacterium]